MNESTARELINAVDSLTSAINSLRDHVSANTTSSIELKDEMRGAGIDLQRLQGSVSDLSRSVEQNISSVDNLASDIRSASSRY